MSNTMELRKSIEHLKAKLLIAENALEQISNNQHEEELDSQEIASQAINQLLILDGF